MKRRAFLQSSVGAIASAVAVERMNLAAGKVRLITRGDDLGCARSLNRAVQECYKKGILKNVSVLAASPYVEEAAKLLDRFLDGACWEGKGYGAMKGIAPRK